MPYVARSIRGEAALALLTYLEGLACAVREVLIARPVRHDAIHVVLPMQALP
jgi:hypothetical protein